MALLCMGGYVVRRDSNDGEKEELLMNANINQSFYGKQHDAGASCSPP